MNFSKESLFLCSNELFGRKRLFCCCRLIYVDPLLKCKFNVCKFSQNDYYFYASLALVACRGLIFWGLKELTVFFCLALSEYECAFSSAFAWRIPIWK